MLLISVWVLFLALLVVLELTRGISRGALRAIRGIERARVRRNRVR